MIDPQMQEFSGRLRRIEKIQKRGGGFEADGTLGQSHYTELRIRNQRRPLLRPAVVFVSAIVLFKGVLLASVGHASYSETLANLHQGGTVDQLGAFVMAIDPVTSTIAQMITQTLG